MVKKIKSDIPQNVVLHPDVKVGMGMGMGNGVATLSGAAQGEKGEKEEKGEKPENSTHKSKYDKIFDIESEDEEQEEKHKKVEAPVVPIVNIPKETISRLLKDIKDMVTSSLEEEYGIYYKHSDTNILKAYVLIVGPEDSLYFGGYYFFTIDFPVNYPYEPPLVTFLVSDSNTRFHPNFHKSGKVCLSIINTWRGEQWTSCLTLKSVLITIVSILDSKPMLHEPGVTQTYADFNNYHNMIAFKNIDYACLQQLRDFNKKNIVFSEKEGKEYKEYFYNIMKETFKKNAKKLYQVIRRWISKEINNFYTINVMYNMSCYVNFNDLEEKFLEYVKENNMDDITK
jgi:ubiquitin-conjugating enzyme E2 Z